MLLKPTESHKYDELKVRRLWTHVTLLRNTTDSEWVCVIDTQARGVDRFSERISCLTKVASRLSKPPDVIFLSGTGTGTRLACGLETLEQGHVGTGYIVRRQAFMELINNGKSIREATLQGFLRTHLACARANPPLLWGVRRPVRVGKIIASARPTLIVYGPTYPFIYPVLRSLASYFRLVLYLGTGGSKIPGLPEPKSTHAFTGTEVANCILLIDTLRPLFRYPVMTPTSFWFTGNPQEIQKEPMRLWYATRNRLPIRNVLVNHNTQKKFLCSMCMLEPSVCDVVPLFPLRTPGPRWSCEKVIGRLLAIYDPGTFLKLLALVAQAGTNANLRLVVVGSGIHHSHIAACRKHSVQFFGNLSTDDLYTELLRSEYAWLSPRTVAPMSSLTISQIDLARTSGCKILGADSVVSDIVATASSTVGHITAVPTDPNSWIHALCAT